MRCQSNVARAELQLCGAPHRQAALVTCVRRKAQIGSERRLMMLMGRVVYRTMQRGDTRHRREKTKALDMGIN